MWSDLIKQELGHDLEALIPVSDVLDIIQRALVLLANANNTVSETRWEIALGSVHTSFKKYGKGEFDDAGADLFGEVFKGELVKKVEADAALSKVVNIANRSSSVKVFQRPT